MIAAPGEQLVGWCLSGTQANLSAGTHTSTSRYYWSESQDTLDLFQAYRLSQIAICLIHQHEGLSANQESTTHDRLGVIHRWTLKLSHNIHRGNRCNYSWDSFACHLTTAKPPHPRKIHFMSPVRGYSPNQLSTGRQYLSNSNQYIRNKKRLLKTISCARIVRI